MRKSMVAVPCTTAVAGMLLTPAAALAAMRGAAAPMPSHGWLATHAQHARAQAAGNAEGNTDPSGSADTTVTFTVGSGALTITAPAGISLTTGSGLPGTAISGTAGTPVTVTDNRAALTPSWTVTAEQADFTNDASTGLNPIPVIPGTDEHYAPGTISATNIVATAVPAQLSDAGVTTVVTAAGAAGDNSASWEPTLSVAIPGTAVLGSYTGILTESVS